MSNDYPAFYCLAAKHSEPLPIRVFHEPSFSPLPHRITKRSCDDDLDGRWRLQCGAYHRATDEIGMQAVENAHHVRDFHVTLLRLLGIDDNKLTYYHAGRFKQLSQFGGKMISELVA